MMNPDDEPLSQLPSIVSSGPATVNSLIDKATTAADGAVTNVKNFFG
jgi:hypothetical protein